MKKHMRRLMTMILAVCLIMTFSISVFAEGDESTSPQSAVMKVAFTYVTDSGDYLDWSYGTCFMINKNTVLTTYHTFVFLSEDERQACIQALKDTYGIDEPNLRESDSHFHIYVLPNRDTRVECSIDPNAKSDVDHLDFVTLHLQTDIQGRTPLPLGDSSALQQTDPVHAYGFPDDSLENKEENTISDVSAVSGTVSKMTVMEYCDVIEHSAQLSNGNSGGPLLNDAKEVVGINEFIRKQKNYSIQINQVKSILDTYGIEYQRGGPEPTPTPIENDTQVEEAPDKSALQAAIESAGEEDLSEYTDDAVSAVQTALDKANVVNNDANATQEQIDDAKKALNDAVADLPNHVKKSLFSPLLIALIAAAVAAIIIIILIISSSKKKAEAERNRQRMNMNSGSLFSGPMDNASGFETEPTDMMGAASTIPMDDGSEGTVMLNQGAEGTTLLSNVNEMGGAYLIRKNTGEKVVLSHSNFSIGKEKSKVDYCITDNTAVSRKHAVIVRNGENFYLIDQGSTNLSYVNGAKAYANTEVPLADDSIIKLADEEFEFHIS